MLIVFTYFVEILFLNYFPFNNLSYLEGKIIKKFAVYDLDIVFEIKFQLFLI